MDSVIGALVVILFVWFIATLIKPSKFAPFLHTGPRKKALVLFVVGSMILGFIGGKIDNKKGGPGATTKQAQKAPVYKIGDTVKDKNFEITVLDKSTAKDVYDETGLLKTTANGKYIVLHVKFKNVAKTAKKLSNNAFTIKKGDTSYSPSILTVRTDKNIFLSELNPGVEKVGELYFDVPEEVANSQDLVLKMNGAAFGSDNGNGQINLN